MPTIIANSGVVTQINVFSCTPENQQPLIDLLIEAANAVQGVPGWMSASLHRNAEGTRVVNYAQCANHEAWLAIMERLKAGGILERNKVLGMASPGLYEVVYTLDA